MKYLAGLLLIAACAGTLHAQGDPVLPIMWDTTTVSIGIGSTILPTPIAATKRLAQGGGGIIGGNVTVNASISREIAPHWRIPFSISFGFMRGNESFYHRDPQLNGDTVVNAWVIANQSNAYSFQLGLEYIDHHELISPFAGVDIAYNRFDATRLSLTIPNRADTLLNQTMDRASRFGIVLRAGAEFPLFDCIYYGVSVELGAFNLTGRPTGTSDTTAIGQLLVPTQLGRDEYFSRVAEGKSGEAIATFFRLLIKAAWRF